MQASFILDRVRYRLSDYKEPTNQTWADARLISLLNDALLELSLETRLFTDVGLVQLVEGVATYDISNLATKIERVEFDNRPLPLVSMRELDMSDYRDYDRDQRTSSYHNRDFAGYLPDDIYSTDWQDREGPRPRAIVYDQNRAGVFTVYPRPANLENNTGSQTTANQLDGVITGIVLNNVDLDVIDGTLPVNSSDDITNYIEVIFTKKPTVVTASTDELDDVISSQVATIIQHYITGHAYRDNNQEQYRALGAEEIQLYNAGKASLMREKSVGNVSRIRTTEYRPFD